jgi:hypothetical protein
MFKKMSYKKVEEDRNIKNLEKRICDLENPYKFNIGDTVECVFYDNTIDFGLVVAQECEYVDTSHQFRILWHSYDSPPLYQRNNYYKVYFEQTKSTNTFNEDLIKQHKLKKLYEPTNNEQ